MNLTQSPSSSTPYETLNRTELYQLCRRAGLTVAPDATRERMVALLWGEEEAGVETEHPVDRYRLALIGFVSANWEKIQTQITCPMRDLPTNPRPCFGCTDTRVLACMVDNHANKDKIEKHMPRRNK